MELFSATQEPAKTTPLPLHKRIAQLRKRFGYTQEQFAAKLGIKRSSLGAYEENRAEPPMQVMIQMRKIFRMKSVEDFYTGEKSAPASTIADEMYRKYIGIPFTDQQTIDMILDKSRYAPIEPSESVSHV